MGKHSKHNHTQHQFGHAEKAMAKGDWGTLETRIGSDSQLPFGYCALSNQPCCVGQGTEAVMTPTSGRIYRREAILESLLAQKQSNNEAALQAEKLRLQDRQVEDRLAQRARELEVANFKHKVGGASSVEISTSDRKRKALDDSASGAFLTDNTRLRLLDDRTDAQKDAHLNAVSFWMHTAAPDFGAESARARQMGGTEAQLKHLERAVLDNSNTTRSGLAASGAQDYAQQHNKAVLVAETSALGVVNAGIDSSAGTVLALTNGPDSGLASYKPRCVSPFSRRPLKTSDLIPIALESDNQTGSVVNSINSTGRGDIHRYCCPVSKKTITTQQCVYVCPTALANNKKKKKKEKEGGSISSVGTIMTQEAYEKLAKPSKTCPVTGLPFDPRDPRQVLFLHKAGTAFSASGNVESKLYRPTL